MIDPRLLAWARRAARQPARGCHSGNRGRAQPIPPLWLFTDARRLPDPRPAVARLPRGLAGVVLRHDGDPQRAALGRDLARLCRARHLPLVVAGDVRLAVALRAGVHLRAGRWPDPLRRPGFITSSAHSLPDLRRARQAGADLVFLSPVFPTPSHPGAPALGALRWTRMARNAGLPAAALGGVQAARLRRLPPSICRAIGAIGALA